MFGVVDPWLLPETLNVCADMNQYKSALIKANVPKKVVCKRMT